MTRHILNRRNKEININKSDNNNEQQLVQPYDIFQQRGNSSSPQINFTKISKFQSDTNVAALIYPTNNSNGLRNNYDPYNTKFITTTKQQQQQLQQLNNNNNNNSPLRFTPDTSVECENEINPEDSAIQFVPALQSHTTTMMRRTHSASPIRDTVIDASWDAILIDEENKIPENKSRRMNGQQQDAVTTVSGIHTRKTGGRIARLAALFTSRASVQGDNTNESSSPIPTYSNSRGITSGINNNVSNTRLHLPTTITPPPVSPAQSSGSSAYVGWPGTQDKRGQTVARPSSYDDSSEGGGFSALRRLQVNNTTEYDKQIQDAAFEEMNRWTESNNVLDTSFDDLSSIESSTITRNNNPATRRIIRQKINIISRSSPVQEETIPVDLDEDHHEEEEDESIDNENLADYHMADTAVTDTRQNQSINRQSLSSLRYAQSDIGQDRKLVIPRTNTSTSPIPRTNTSTSNNSTSNNSVRFHDIFPPDRTDTSNRKVADNWGSESSCGASSNEGSSFSKTSSAYFNSKIIKTPSYSNELKNNVTKPHIENYKFGRYGDIRNAGNVTAAHLLRKSGVVPPTEESLAANDRLTAPHRTYTNTEGFRGLLDKSKDVPCLMDAMDSDSMSSSKATSVYSEINNGNQQHNGLNNLSQRKQDIHQPIPLVKKHIINQRTKDISPRSILRKNNYVGPVDLDNDSDVFDDISVANESDVFDNISSGSPRKSRVKRTQHYPARIAEEDDPNSDNNEDSHVETMNKNNFKLVVLAGGITTIQTSDMDYSNRQTASDFDDQLTNSEVSSNGYIRIPGINEMITAGTQRDSSLHGIHGNLGMAPRPRNVSNTARSLVLDDVTNVSYEEDSQSEDDDEENTSTGYDVEGDLSEYYLQPSLMKKVLNRYRELSELFDSDMTLEEFEKEEDEHKAFALFEMRSRIMEKDIERGLERRGGSFVVDDLVTTAYNRTAHRIRDAVIVCKAWRDGASISDVVKASLLGRRGAHTHFIRRRIRNNANMNYHNSSMMSDSMSAFSEYSAASPSAKYHWEPVKWLDDTDFMQYRCPSLGSRHMRGFEMFTIGDCQSILLKLTNERCMELRHELNVATARQIEAEEMLKEERDNFVGEMSDAEFDYLSSMEEVKMISKQLVKAEQSFTLVRDRIQKLISKYENILMKIETESSIVTYESSYYSDYNSEHWDAIEQKELEMWAKRAKRAEIRAEIAAREAFLAKQETRQLYEDRELELAELKKKLIEFQSEASSPSLGRETSAMIVKSLAMRRNDVIPSNQTAKTVQESKNRISNEKIQDVKQRFRERMAAKKQDSGASISTDSYLPYGEPQVVTPTAYNHNNAKDLFRSAGEEMFQQMDFYERSLNAVERTRF